jgi:hypothetical protein
MHITLLFSDTSMIFNQNRLVLLRLTWFGVATVRLGSNIHTSTSHI